MKINSVIWDYDGTLVDTKTKNLNVTKAIISEITGDINIENSVLNSLENYEQANIRSSNWRELYRNEFGLNEEQIDNAGRLWTKLQLQDNTEVELYDGISFTVQNLNAYSQGIVSQNSSRIIKNNLEKFKLEKYFNHIVGYEEVDLSRQKPAPEGLLNCIAEITTLKNNDSVIYIGDHNTDIECAYHANERLGRKTIISILINYNNRNLINGWEYKPDFIANSSEDILEIIYKRISEL